MGFQAPGLHPHPQPQGGEHFSQVSSYLQAPGILACTGAQPNWEPIGLPTFPMSQDCWMGQGLLCILGKCEAPQGAQWSGFEAEGQKPAWAGGGGCCGFAATNHPAYHYITSWQSYSSNFPSTHEATCLCWGADEAPGRESHHFPHPSLHLHPEAPEAGFLSLASVCSHGLHREASLSETLVLWCVERSWK